MSNNKRLERDLQNKVLGGVCSGLGNYFDMGPTFWRVLFFFLFFAGLSGLLIYIVLWIVMPAMTVQPANAVDGMDATGNADEIKRSHNGQMVTGLTLIAIGAISLIARYVPQISWRLIWPVILIVVGIILIVPFKDKNS